MIPVARRGNVAEAQLRALQRASQPTPSKARLTLPLTPSFAEPSWHLYCIRHQRRDWLREQLDRAGIETLIHYPIPPHLQDAYRDAGWAEGSLPVAEAMAREVLSLPIDPHMTDAEVTYVSQTVAEVAGAQS